MKKLEEFYPLIGKMVIEFQQLDMTLNMLMMGLLFENPDVIMAFMTALPFGKKLDVLRAVAPCKVKQKDLIEKLDELVPSLSRAEELRNRIVHASWVGSNTGDKVFFHKPQVSRKDGIKNGGIRNATTTEIDEAIKAIQAGMSALCHWAGDLERQGVMRTKMFQRFKGSDCGFEVGELQKD